MNRFIRRKYTADKGTLEPGRKLWKSLPNTVSRLHTHFWTNFLVSQRHKPFRACFWLLGDPKPTCATNWHGGPTEIKFKSKAETHLISSPAHVWPPWISTWVFNEHIHDSWPLFFTFLAHLEVWQHSISYPLSLYWATMWCQSSNSIPRSHGCGHEWASVTPLKKLIMIDTIKSEIILLAVDLQLKRRYSLNTPMDIETTQQMMATWTDSYQEKV